MGNEVCNEDGCLTDGEPAIVVDGLKVFYGAKAIIEEVQFQAQPCSLTALIGPSGCGKSTFLTCLNRMVDFVPDQRVSGSIRILGEDVLHCKTNLLALRRRVGMIFQKPNPFPTTILKNITLTLKFNGLRDRHKALEIAEKVLKEVGLWDEIRDRLHGSALALSGGQQQRLCIARALAIAPKVILLDEPCSSLDPVSTGKIEELLLRLRGEYTVVIVTHNLGQARRIADRTGLFWLVNSVGRLIEFETTEALFNSPRLKSTAAFIQGRIG